MPARERLTGLDASFLHLERGAAHMHVASCQVFEGPPPAYEDLVEHIEGRLHLVPRYRWRLAPVPFGQGRPVWVDDPHFSARYHIRHTALPAPGGEAELRRLCGRVFSQALDRAKPLWEIWLAEGLQRGRFALLSKAHHALVDGVSGVDIVAVLLDPSPEPPVGARAPEAWAPEPPPSPAQLLADALLERATAPDEIVRSIRRLGRGPRRAARRLAQATGAVGAFALPGVRDPAPSSPFNVRIGPHRRFAWVQADLADFRAIKNALGGSINDAVLTVVAGATGRLLRGRGHPTRDLRLRALVPVSVRAGSESGAPGNRVAAMWAPLPVGVTDPLRAHEIVQRAMADIKRSGQVVGAKLLTEATGFASPTILAQAARLQARQRLFNLVVTNIPGPQVPLYLLGRRMEAIYPLVPLAQNTALGVAVLSYNGVLNFGLNGDFDAMADLDALADALEAAIADLASAAGTPAQP